MGLVGRASELRELRASLGGERVVAVRGVAGIGKTALVATAVAGVAHRRVEALSLTASVPYAVSDRLCGRRVAGEPTAIAGTVLDDLRGAVAVVDNLQWVDAASSEVLELVAGRMPLVVTARPGACVTSPSLADGANEIVLGPLGHGATERLARTRHPHLDDTARAALVGVAGGNPLLVEALASPSAWCTPTLRAALGDRLASLDPVVRRALALLVLLGPIAGPALLTESEGSVLDNAGLDPAAVASLRHDLLAVGVEEHIDAGELRLLHRRLADRLDDAAAARHELHGGRPRRCRERALAAAAGTVRPLERGRLLALASEASEQDGTPDPIGWLTAAQALLDGGSWFEAGRALDRIDVEAVPTTVAGEAWRQRARVRWFEGDIEASRAAFDRAYALAGARGPLRTRVLVERAHLELRDRTSGAVALADEALAEAEASGHEVLRARSTHGAAMVYDQRPGWEEYLTAVVDEAHAVGDLDLSSATAHHLSSGLGFWGRPLDGLQVASRQLDRLGAHAAGPWVAHLRCVTLIDRAVLSLDLPRTVTEAAAFLVEHPIFRNRAQAALAGVLALIDLDRSEEAAAWTAAGRTQVRFADEVVVHGAAEAELAWSLDDVDRMQAVLARTRADGGDAWFGMRLFVEVAAAHLFAEHGLAVEPDLPAQAVPTFWPGLHELEGLTRAGAGDDARALVELDRAGALWRSQAMPRFAVRSALTAADVAHRAGRRDAATRRRRALHEARRLGLTGLLRRSGTSTANLTAKEATVLRHVAAGLTSAEIARTLTIATGTVDQHVAAACRKLGATNRREAAARLLDR